MRKMLLIARRDYKATVRTKGFIAGLLLAPVLMSGSLVVFFVFKDRVETKDKRIAFIDRSGLVAQAVESAARRRNETEVTDAVTGAKVEPAYHVEIVPPEGAEPDARRLDLSNRVRRGELHAFIEVGEGVLHPRRDREAAAIGYYAKNPALDDLRRWIEGPINEELRRLRLAEAGVDAKAVDDLFDWVGTDGLGLVSADPATGKITPAARRSRAEALLLPLALPMILFIMILMGAVPQLNSVMEEKSQRIAEVMLGSVTPFQFSMGKLVGGVCVSLTAAAFYVAGAVAAVSVMDLGAYIPYGLLPWFFAYVVLAIFMFGALFAAMGAACNDAAEAQSVTLPAMLPVIVPMFVQMPIVTQPHSTFATVMSLFPLFTPQLMLIRQATQGGVPAWQPWVGLAGVVLCTLLLVWAGGRIFRVGILLQGTPPRLGNLLRWAIRG